MTASTVPSVTTLGFIAAGILAASSPAHAQQQGIANPAATFCVEQGGRSVMRGNVGYCRLPDGRMVEEWAFFRERNGTGGARSPAVGMSNPAADHCTRVGGRNVTRRDRSGAEAAFCRLRNGRTVDAWQLFRRDSQRGGAPRPR